jgi:exopolyphosphatase/guanosine-5'-triphosphate,3'-diphosphate pyrophosphatase
MKPFIKAGKHICILLRIAVLLHRGRTNQPVPEVDIVIDNKTILLRFPENWLDEHSMTLADLIKEINHLDAAGFKLSFE